MIHNKKMSDIIGECEKCPLYKDRTRIVYGVGTENPSFVIVGEAPGKTEDEGGKPFIGRSGQLMRKVIAELGLNVEEEFFITNTCRCRPLDNRTPKTSEIAECSKYLITELNMLSPKLIIAVGAVPSKALLGKGFKMADSHGKIMASSSINIPILPCYHPAAVLRNPLLKEVFKQDLSLLLDYK